MTSETADHLIICCLFVSACWVYSCLGLVMLLGVSLFTMKRFPFMALEGWEQEGEQVMKGCPWDYILWILDYIWQYSWYGGGHGGEEDYISYVVFWCGVLENLIRSGFTLLFYMLYRIWEFPLYMGSNHYTLFYFSLWNVIISMWIRKL